MTILGAILPYLIDTGGRRAGIDRRQFSYTDHVPSRRSNSDRRSVSERRSVSGRRNGVGRRDHQIGIEIQDQRKNKIDGRRSGFERRRAFAVAMR